jgi:transposase
LFPADLREWLPEGHPAHFIVETFERLDLGTFKVNSTRSEQYPPGMMAMLLLYFYATGRMSSRVIEAATYMDTAGIFAGMRRIRITL